MSANSSFETMAISYATALILGLQLLLISSTPYNHPINNTVTVRLWMKVQRTKGAESLGKPRYTVQ